MRLTTRQTEIARLVARGWSNRRIAAEVGLSAETVKAHIRDGASRIPGTGPARYKLVFFVLTSEKAEVS